jgi:hypothetical protein
VTAPAKHQGSGSSPVPELLVRQVLREGFVEAVEDDLLLTEVFTRQDDLLQGSQDSWLDDMKASFRRMVLEDVIGIHVGYPDDVARLPYVSIVLEGGLEDEGAAVLGDVLGVDYEAIGTGTDEDGETTYPVDDDGVPTYRSYQHTVVGCEETTTLQIGTWTLAPEDSLLLHAMVRAVLFRHKRRLEGAGINELTFSDSGFQPGQPPWEGHVGYVPLVRCTMRWTRRQTLRQGPVPTYFTIRRPTFSN